MIDKIKNVKKLRKSGINVIGDIDWGTHICQFYKTKEDMLNILIPYFKAGLENNEYCMWITSKSSLASNEAKLNLGQVVNELDTYIKKNQIEFLDYKKWYIKSGCFSSDRVLKGWLEKEKKALEKGFEGIRIAGDSSWIEKKDWRDITEYEAEVNNAIGKHRIVGLCLYSINNCSASEIIDVVANHQQVLILKDGKWKIIKSYGYGKIQKLEKIDELKTAFLNITSHELRTPMTAIKGYTQLLLKEKMDKLSDFQRECLEVVFRNTNRLDALIQDILDVSRLESGTMKFIPEKTDIGTLVTDVVETMKISANKKQIKIYTDVKKELPILMVDGMRIKQVLLNLVDNAIKYSFDGSSINVNVGLDKDDVFFDVLDFGRGIPKEKQCKVFDTFYQVNSGMDRKFGGAGLGLAISRGIVLSHGGKIWCESKENEGSKFRFSLPIEPIKDLEENFKEIEMF